MDERRRLARSRAGGSHAVVFDGPIPPKCVGAYKRAALGGGRLQEFRHLLRQKTLVHPRAERVFGPAWRAFPIMVA